MKTAKQHGLWFHLFDVLLNIVIIVGVVAVIRTFLVSPFQVEGNSMLSTLEHKQYIIINKLAYHTGSPERGDVVVFRPPNDPKRPYVKRVIGIPGDHIVIEGGFVFVRPEGLVRGWTRDRVIEGINTGGVPCFQGSCSEVYLEKAFDGTGFRPKERLQVAKALGETSMMFLVHPTLTKEDIELACSVIEDVAKLAGRHV